MKWLILPLVASLVAAGCCDTSSIPGMGSSGDCSKDTDCRGERICIHGKCRHSRGSSSPQNASTPATATTDPNTAPAPTATTPEPAQNATVEEFVVYINGGRQTGSVRADPNFNGRIVAQLESGTHVGVTGRSQDGTWMSLRWPYPHGSNTGWMHQDILLRPDSVPAPQPTVAAGGCSPLGAMCPLDHGRWGYCQGSGACKDVCPRSMSYHPEDTRCHLRCNEVRCQRCQGELCMDEDKSVNARM